MQWTQNTYTVRRTEGVEAAQCGRTYRKRGFRNDHPVSRGSSQAGKEPAQHTQYQVAEHIVADRHKHAAGVGPLNTILADTDGGQKERQ